MFYCGIDVAKRKHAVVVLDDHGQIQLSISTRKWVIRKYSETITKREPDTTPACVIKRNPLCHTFGA